MFVSAMRVAPGVWEEAFDYYHPFPVDPFQFKIVFAGEKLLNTSRSNA